MLHNFLWAFYQRLRLVIFSTPKSSPYFLSFIKSEAVFEQKKSRCKKINFHMEIIWLADQNRNIFMARISQPLKCKCAVGQWLPTV